ncbi:hypothetical protein BHM03_00057007 [Ensete ventricosum]|nr:hypothetical protein BHM03_00057007 [Ensete ventricosum]
MELDLENPLASADDDEQQRRWASVSALFAAELDHAIAATIDIAVRRDAVSLILQVTRATCSLCDPFSRSPSFPTFGSESQPTNLLLQGEEESPFDSRTIRRMEMLILGALDWRMRSITPFSFLRFFVTFFSPTHPSLLRSLRSGASLTILRAQHGDH